MTTTTPRTHSSANERPSQAKGAATGARLADWRDPRYQAFMLLRVGFVVAPIAFVPKPLQSRAKFVSPVNLIVFPINFVQPVVVSEPPAKLTSPFGK